MTWEIWIALASSLAATAAVAVAILTLREMISQRRTVYRPELILAREYLAATRGDDNELRWQRDGSQSPGSIFPSVPLFNIGLGAARDVELIWDFDRQSFRNILKDVSSGRIVIKHDDGPLVGILIDDEHRITFNSKDFERHLSYVLPAGISSEPNFLNVPIEYATYLELLPQAYSMASATNGIQHWHSVPPLEATIRYRDIGDNLHQRRLRVEFQLCTMRFDKDEGSFFEAGWYSEIVAIKSYPTPPIRLLPRRSRAVEDKRSWLSVRLGAGLNWMRVKRRSSDKHTG